MDLKAKIKALPGSPGVYIMKDAVGRVLYVGKAGNLRKRVSSYFYPNKDLNRRLEQLVRNVHEIEHMPTSTEAEALIYENSLIKRLDPKYNVALRDDKSYPLLKLTVNEKFPRLFITRRKSDDGALYYGPYADAGLLKKAAAALKEAFPLRRCSRLPGKACLYFHIKQCAAPCEGKISRDDYDEMVSELKLFLDGKKAELLKSLSERMAAAAAGERFEKAAELRQRIESLGSIGGAMVSYKPSGETEELRSVLAISGPLDRIEAFDISNIMGVEAVGSMVSFYKGRPDKDNYRRFKITTVSGVDDYAMMREVVGRRYSKLCGSAAPMPSLILIDGGKGHLAAAAGELDRLGLGSIPVIGIAKELELIYTRGRKDPIVLPAESKALHLLKRIRDEAHRFAITYHKLLMSRRFGVSALDGIPGIGAARKKALMGRFGSVEGVKAAGAGELLKVKGINEKTALAIIRYFEKQGHKSF